VKRRCQQAEGQRDGKKDYLQNAVDSDSDNAEGEEQQPHEWIGDQRQQGEGPAEYEEDAPEQECEHGRASLSFLIKDTEEGERKFPWFQGQK
jgi:hypothetical protein